MKLIHCLLFFILTAGSGNLLIAEQGPLIGMERFSKLKKIGTVEARRSEDIKASPWGIQFCKWDLPMDELELYLERAAESGIKWARIETRAFPVEFDKVKGDGYYRWDEFDAIVDGLNKRKIEIFITINTIPFKGLDSEKKKVNKEDLKKWLTCVASIAKRYKGRVTYYEIDNEPKISPNYADLVVAASKVIKGINPKAKIIAGSTARVKVEGIRMMIEDKKIGPYIDVITFHPYNEFPEGVMHQILTQTSYSYEPVSPPIAEVFKILEKEGSGIELWQGECGYPSSEFTTSWKGRGPWSENIQAKWLLRRFLVDFSTGVPVNIYFLLREPPEYGKVNAKGLMTHPTWKRKKGYYALQNICSVFDEKLQTPKEVTGSFNVHDEGSFPGIKGENTRTDKMLEILDPHDMPYKNAKAPMPIQVIGLTGSGGDAVVYYTPWRMSTYVKPAKVDATFKNLSIKDPVLVNLLTGQVYKVKSSVKNGNLTIKGVPLADYPMAVISRKLVSTK